MTGGDSTRARHTARGVATALLLTGLAALARGGEKPWQALYDAGFRLPVSQAWIGPGTRSERTPDGLRIVDASTEAGSGRLYWYPWRVDPSAGATVEARLRVTQASEPWGACVNVADGVHEEDVSFFPDRVVLSYAKIEAPFPADDGFHTYRVSFKAPDIQVWADGRLLLDGRGRFTQPVIEAKRNRLAFGASASTATSDATWQCVRFRGGEVTTSKVSLPSTRGLEVHERGTVCINPTGSYASMFRFASGLLQVDGRRSMDGGRTWSDGSGPWVGACQLPDGEVLSLDYRTHPDAEQGWFASALTRWDSAGAPLPTLRARLHVPDFVTTIDDDGSKRDGPWCDHSIVVLRDGSLLAACSGCFASDTTPVTTYPKEFGAHKYRGFVCCSTDRGLTWEYLATVTADPSLGSEGCNEMDLVRAPNGDLLCLFRTGGNRDRPSPMYQCRSRDEGRTWGKPERVADRGVWPNTCVTRDRVIVCTYGRPGNWLTFSLDSGRTWVGHFCFDDAASTSYNSVEETAPGEVLVMYDRGQVIDDSGNFAAGGIAGAFFTVKRR
jgi:hypothetical protein